jgi:o-succinylbenzoate synthase
MRLKSPFEASIGTVQDRRVLLVEVVADGAVEWGEVTALETPGYNSETTDTTWYMISEFVAPALINQNLSAASEFAPLMSTIRGHEIAKRSLGEVVFPTANS